MRCLNYKIWIFSSILRTKLCNHEISLSDWSFKKLIELQLLGIIEDLIPKNISKLKKSNLAPINKKSRNPYFLFFMFYEMFIMITLTVLIFVLSPSHRLLLSKRLHSPNRRLKNYSYIFDIYCITLKIIFAKITNKVIYHRRICYFSYVWNILVLMWIKCEQWSQIGTNLHKNVNCQILKMGKFCLTYILDVGRGPKCWRVISKLPSDIYILSNSWFKKR